MKELCEFAARRASVALAATFVAAAGTAPAQEEVVLDQSAVMGMSIDWAAVARVCDAWLEFKK